MRAVGKKKDIVYTRLDHALLIYPQLFSFYIDTKSGKRLGQPGRWDRCEWESDKLIRERDMRHIVCCIPRLAAYATIVGLV